MELNIAPAAAHGDRVLPCPDTYSTRTGTAGGLQRHQKWQTTSKFVPGVSSVSGPILLCYEKIVSDVAYKNFSRHIS